MKLNNEIKLSVAVASNMAVCVASGLVRKYQAAS